MYLCSRCGIQRIRIRKFDFEASSNCINFLKNKYKIKSVAILCSYNIQLTDYEQLHYEGKFVKD